MAHPAAWNGWIDFDGLLLSRPKSAALAVKCEDLFVSVVLSVSVHGDECVSLRLAPTAGLAPARTDLKDLLLDAFAFVGL